MIYYLLKAAVLPPGLNLALIIFGFAIKRRWRRLGRFSIALGVLSLWFFSTGFGVGVLGSNWEPEVLDIRHAPDTAGAIVILGGGRKQAPEYERGETISPITLTRLRYGAYLHRKSELPILVTGGKVLGTEDNAEAVLMADALEDEFGVPVRWLEDESRNTFENAVNSARMLRDAGIEHILLVTQAAHMHRAQAAFVAQDIVVTAAPTAFIAAGDEPGTVWDFIPAAQYLQECQWLLHERLGTLWYKLRRAMA